MDIEISHLLVYPPNVHNSLDRTRMTQAEARYRNSVLVSHMSSRDAVLNHHLLPPRVQINKKEAGMRSSQVLKPKYCNMGYAYPKEHLNHDIEYLPKKPYIIKKRSSSFASWKIICKSVGERSFFIIFLLRKKMRHSLMFRVAYNQVWFTQYYVRIY